MLRHLIQQLVSRRGQALVEYVLIIALIAVAALAALQVFGNNASSMVSSIAQRL